MDHIGRLSHNRMVQLRKAESGEEAGSVEEG